jgi:hypothetical protein
MGQRGVHAGRAPAITVCAGALWLATPRLGAGQRA